jgi:hypothetical protein
MGAMNPDRIVKELCQWVGRRSNPRLRLFRPPLHRLSYQPVILEQQANEKSPASLGHRAFKLLAYLVLAERHKRSGSGELPATGAEQNLAMCSCLELSRNQTMATSQPEKSLSIDPIRQRADRASSTQPIRRRSVPRGSQDFFAEFRSTNYAGTFGNPRSAMDY